MPGYFEVHHDEMGCFYRRQLQFPKHLHAHAELIVMLAGSTEAYADGRGGQLLPGQVFLAFPHQVHEYLHDSEGVQSLLFAFMPESVPEFASLLTKRQPENPIFTPDAAFHRPLMERVRAELAAPHKFSRAVADGYLSLLLADLFRAVRLERATPYHVTAIRRVLEYCQMHYSGPITLEDIAQSTHMSKYYLSHLFGKEVGMSLPQYIATLRVRQAQNLLIDGGVSVTDIAYAVGFNSLRSFNRQFALITGKTPSDFQRAATGRG